MKNLINNNLKSDWLNPDTYGPTRKRHNATTLHVTDRHRADRMSRTIRSFLMRRTCFPWDIHAQARTTTGRYSVALATPTLRRLHREETKRISSRHCATEGVPDELVTDVSSDATHWPTNKPNEPEARIENMILRHGFWSRPLREQPPCKNLSTPTVSTLNLPDYSTQKLKHTRTNNLNFTNYAWSVVVGKQRRQDRQKRGETKGNLPKTLPQRNPTNCAAIRTRWWACTGEQDVRQTLREAPALVNFKLDTEKTSQRDETEMTSPHGSPKKGVGWIHHWRLNWNKRT